MVLKFIRGVSVYVSGRMAKLAPDDERATESLALVGGGAAGWHQRAESLIEAWRAAPTAADA